MILPLWVVLVLDALLAVLFVALFLMLSKRNREVRDFRLRLVECVHAACNAAITCGNLEYEWRYDVYDSVSYDEMLRQFWRPLDSFYPDRRFLDPEARDPKGGQA